MDVRPLRAGGFRADSDGIVPMQSISSASSQRPGTALWALAISNTVAATVLVGSEIFVVAASIEWSLTGLLHLGPALYLPLGAVLFAASAAGTAWFARHAWAAERAVMHGEQPPGFD